MDRSGRGCPERNRQGGTTSRASTKSRPVVVTPAQAGVHVSHGSRLSPGRRDQSIQFEDILAPGLTTIFPPIRGCSEQKYSYSPCAATVWEKATSVASPADLNFRSFSTTVCTSSSALVQVTVV